VTPVLHLTRADRLLQVRFVLSDQNSFDQGGSEPMPNSWPYQEFYNVILDKFQEMSEKRRKDLLKWWNEFVVLASVSLVI
jgi:hypothetical protein